MFFRHYLPPGSGRLRKPATIDPTLDLCTRYPLGLVGPRKCGIQFARHFYTWSALGIVDSFNHSDLLPLRSSISLVPRQLPEVNNAHDSGRVWESNPRPSDLESNALFTWPHAPSHMLGKEGVWGRECQGFEFDVEKFIVILIF